MNKCFICSLTIFLVLGAVFILNSETPGANQNGIVVKTNNDSNIENMQETLALEKLQNTSSQKSQTVEVFSKMPSSKNSAQKWEKWLDKYCSKTSAKKLKNSDIKNIVWLELQPIRWDKEFFNIFKELESLKGIRLEAYDLDDKSQNYSLAHLLQNIELENLERIHLYGIDEDPEDLKAIIKSFPHVIDLHIDSDASFLTQEELLDIFSDSKIKSLDLSLNEYPKDQPIYALRSISHLEELTLNMTNLTPSNIEIINDLGLKILKIEEFKIVNFNSGKPLSIIGKGDAKKLETIKKVLHKLKLSQFTPESTEEELNQFEEDILSGKN